MKLFSIPFLLLFFFFYFVTTIYGITEKEIIRLKNAGLSDQTIQDMIKEKTLETCAFSIEEIVALKSAGVTEETIQVLIREQSFLKDVNPVVYGKDIRPIRLATVNELIELKRAGMSDDVLRAILIYSGSSAEKLDRENAWKMLKNSGVIVDTRGSGE